MYVFIVSHSINFIFATCTLPHERAYRNSSRTALAFAYTYVVFKRRVMAFIVWHNRKGNNIGNTKDHKRTHKRHSLIRFRNPSAMAQHSLREETSPPPRRDTFTSAEIRAHLRGEIKHHVETISFYDASPEYLQNIKEEEVEATSIPPLSENASSRL